MMRTEDMGTGFKYTYSAKEQEEIRKIREKYEASEENGMKKLRKLDAAATNKATCVALVFGVVGTLILGIGISLILTNFGILLGLQKVLSMVLGIGLGIVGIVLAILAYPAYRYVIKKEREKIAPEILRLTEMLMK